MNFDGLTTQLPDIDPDETAEWLESLDQVLAVEGRTRARYLITRLLERARAQQVGLPSMVSTDYINTIAPDQEPWFPGDEEMERRIRRIVRWNAAVMVTRANKKSEGIGGHLSTYASSASLYEVGFNHFFQGKDDGRSGDQVYYQGHAAPGIYAHAFLEGRLTEAQLDNFRMESGGNGLSSYPHPRLMPDFWEFPSVSMGIAPLNAIYQARFNRYLLHRRIADTSESRVWCFVGDGECDEPEALGALGLAAREQLDNLIFVVSCNLQRLDGPVRGDGKIIQELEAVFRGAGWNVIKVIWGREWDELLARDVDGVLVNKMNTTVDGEFQKYATETGAYIREHFFGPDPRLRKLADHLSDDDLRKLRRGGHDYRKLYAAYKLATEYEGAPTVILAHTIKGWTLGADFEARNATHQIKKMSEAELKAFRDTLELPIADKQLEQGVPPYYHPGADSPEVEYLHVRRRILDGPVPRRVVRAKELTPPGDAPYAELIAGSGGRAASTTMAFAGLLRALLRDKGIGRRIVPIIPDEARTFGMDALFREVKIYAPFGQKYEPVDAQMLLSYTEASDGQLLEEGITEAGSMASFTAAGTAYATHGEPMIPFYIFYSMFGFQRVGDLVWAFGDARGRGFLLGATAGRTTLNGEGLQHEDGHSHILFSVVPNVRAYDPAFAYELATIVRDGLQRMYADNEDVFYYITLYNENYAMPPMQAGIGDGILRGLYLYKPAAEKRAHHARILASGTAMMAALEAQSMLADKHDVAADVWSATSFPLLRNDALEVERWNRLHPTEKPRTAYITEQLGGSDGPIVAVTDYMKSVPDMVSRFVPGPFIPLGTDGYGRSDTRPALRRHFETDAAHVTVATLQGLALQGDLVSAEVAEAIDLYGIGTELPDPRLR
ncbi:MAG TPA: pyruvate dehydrogenase (acetyl-transferring), homodimeric type [Candidatus Dormibacteraeota bacterium]|jgi:pyruvate dehydrogenase E1 component|nr:pyruvate dehydrogenase (acetyl-transferring), homodimeric type [Candidatus Dormibacteraeota bacterium]